MPVGRPLWLAVTSGLGKLSQRSAVGVVVGVVIAIEPDIFAELAALPIGALSGDHDGMAVGRNLNISEADRVKEFVQRELGLAGCESKC